MYASLLIPLDRSSLAEQALPLAIGIARQSNARLDLVEVHSLYALEDPTAGRAPYDPGRDAERRRQEQLYLDATAGWVASVSPVAATTGVLSGSSVLPATVAESLLERARDGGADLIVMATHARGPLGRLGAGSVADELLRRAQIPVLLVPPGDKPLDAIPEPVVDNVLIPLDGSSRAEQVLGPALELARLMEARCSLLQVVDADPTPAEPGAGGTTEKSRAEAYLGRVAERLRGQGVEVLTRVVVARNAAGAILAEAEALRSNLIALATHGRGGLNRLLLGSVADKLVRGANSPVLVYRPTGKGH